LAQRIDDPPLQVAEPTGLPAPIRRGRWALAGFGFNRRVALYLFHASLFHIGLFGMTDVILNFYFVSLGHNSDTIGWLQGVARIGGFLTGIPMGLLADRLGGRRVSIYSMLGAALTYGLLIFWPSLPVLVLSRFLAGLGYGAAAILPGPLLLNFVPREQQTRLFAFYNLLTMVATSFGSFIAGFLPTCLTALALPLRANLPGASDPQSAFAYGAALLVAGLLIGLSVLPLFWLGDSTPPARADERRAGVASLRALPWLYLSFLSLPVLFFGFTAGMTFPFYNLFFRTTFHLPDQAVSSILSVGWLFMGLMTMITPWWDRRFGSAGGLGLAMGIAAVAFIGLGGAHELGLGIFFFVVAVCARNAMVPLFTPLIMRGLPVALHNITSSLGNTLWSLGFFVASAVSGIWQQTYGFGLIMTSVAVGLLFTGAAVVLIFRKQRSYQEPMPEIERIEDVHRD
jgi:MFS family permease